MKNDTPVNTTADTSIGDRVAELRNRRGLTQEQLADRAGLSVNLIRKIEQNRGGARMESYHAIARAMGVITLMFAVPGSPAPQPSSNQDHALAGIRAAVNPPAGMRGPLLAMGMDTPDLAMLTQATRRLATHYKNDEYDSVAHLAPAVVRSAHLHVDALDGDQEAAARRLRSDALGVAGRYLIQIREHDLALVASRDALQDALAVGDTSRAARAISAQAWALLRQGRFSEVEDLCSHSADEVEPAKITKASPDELAAWGWLLLRASAAAARNNRPQEAATFFGYATSAAAPIDREVENSVGQTFGRLTVAMKGPENALVADRPDKALELAAKLPRDTGDVMRSDWHRHRIDKANAHTKMGNTDKAETILQNLRQEAPDWLRYQQSARETTEDLLDGMRKPSQSQRDLADFLGVPL
ncbi:helix-turn-helix domain-containing protein [Streptomonospora sediminis]